jgi:hypothetical protein
VELDDSSEVVALADSDEESVALAAWEEESDPDSEEEVEELEPVVVVSAVAG